MKKRTSLVSVLVFVLGLALTGMTAVSLHSLVFAAESPATEAFTFVQLCDTQLGGGGYEQSVSSFKQAVRLINALEVDFAVICGDLIHRDYYDANSIADFKEIMAGFTVPCYLAPGNHDVGNTPTVASLNRYRQVFGEDYFSVEHKGYTFVIANTSLWGTQVQGESQTHDSWFKQTLADARDKNSPVFVVQHHPVNTLPTANELLTLFETSGVVAVLSGHRHQLIIDEYKGIQLVTGEATSTNDGPLGFRLWHVDSPTSITHEFIPLSLEIPTVDFNGDEIVDCADMCIMVDHWGEDYALCDIAPPPFGDGIVDVQDLIALAKHLFEDYRLMAHWKLDETDGTIAYDSAGNNDGVLTGGPLWQPADGQIDGALAFDGTDDYVSADFVLNPADGPFSVFAWIRGGAPGQVILSQVDTTTERGVQPGSTWLGTDPSDGKLITVLMAPPFAQLMSESVVTDDQWHHVGLVYNLGGFRRHLYVDGVEIAKDTGIVSGVSSGGGLYICAGKNLDPGTFWFGLIDDVRIYDRAVTP